ncbi:MAG: cytochrome c oxidase assembly protein [Betaproteobacteria bacterium]|jgi:cytochrome c oxidase assembly protein subunit 11|nr:cytochrome c oxidase assembly protein [Betaproteobacteria bacterium]
MSQTPESSPTPDASAKPTAENSRMMGKLLMVAILMFGFGFALVPFYEKICEITGINVLARKDKLNYAEAREFARNTQVDTSRSITIEFDANVQGSMLFKPKVAYMKVHPGELATVTYEIINVTSNDLVGQAIPSYAPRHSASHFKKLECFCFEQQALKGSQKREFPVVFVIDPKLPPDIGTITLSYTFFEVAGLKSAAGPGPLVAQPSKTGG